MGRPREAIKAQIISGTDRYRIIFQEHPEWTFNTTCTDPEDARRYGRKYKADLFSQRDKGLSFRSMAEGFFDEGGPWDLDQVDSGVKRISFTFQVYQGILKNHLIPLLGDYNISTMLGSDIKRELKDAINQRGGGQLARATKNRCLWVLSLIYNFWISQGIVKASPIDALTKYDDSPENPRGALPREDRAKLFPATYQERLEIWGSPMWTAFFSIMDDTGTRNGEPRALIWEDVKWELEFIPFMKAIETATAAVVKETKNGKEKPGLPSPAALQALKAWKESTKFSGLKDWIFTHDGKSPISNAAAEKRFREVMEKMGYGDRGWTPYWLRHTFITYGKEKWTEEQLRMLAGDSDRINGYKHPDAEALYKESIEAKKVMDQERTNPGHGNQNIIISNNIENY